MTAALALPSLLPGQLHDQGISRIPADLTYEQWEQALYHAERIEAASPWWVADLLAYGQARFGEDSSQALPTAEDDPSGVRQAKLKQAGWMADRWPVGTRVPGASYTHHRIVAKLDRDEAVSLLEAAVTGAWSTRELAREVDARVAAIPARAEADEPPACAAEQAWVPSLDDLTVDHRRSVEQAAASRTGTPHCEDAFVAGALWALRYSLAEACFRPDRWRD